MKLGWNCLKLTVLVSVLGLTIWTIGCGEPASPPISSGKSNGHEAGSTKGGGTDVPASEVDTGATKPADAKAEPKADAEKPAEADKKEEPKADDAK